MKPLSKRDEERLIAAGRRYYSTAFPNPERVGCPGTEILEALSLRKLDRATAEKWDSHISQCSPCFNEYVALRESRRRRERLRRLAVAAAIAVVLVAGLVVHHFVVRTKEQPEPPGQSGSVTYQANLLDLRDKAALRGAESGGNGSAAVLPRAPLALSIYLPTGSEPGDYEVQVTKGPGQALLKAEGNAILRDHVAVLEVKLDVQGLRPGQYLFWIRQSGTSWSYYPVAVGSAK
jgi:Cell wall synthesis protein CwsA